ncbi:hypothetical protein K438DRAFT_1208436 [Mycena galopus ATCC 62051]|nr:hypothetical protein K438DRAFT_353717 [Mycena galopus ATCC 62051]KAF8180076.1 hypothetical protein K438DRAFT_1208436 [Mycena galopus ATCC 62051]
MDFGIWTPHRMKVAFTTLSILLWTWTSGAYVDLGLTLATALLMNLVVAACASRSTFGLTKPVIISFAMACAGRFPAFAAWEWKTYLSISARYPPVERREQG